MQPQLKPCGDTSTPNRHPNHHRSFSKKPNSSKANANASGPAFLATDVTMLDINTTFHAKKSKRHTAPATPTLGYFGAHGANHFNFPSYLNPASLYNNMDIVGGNGDLPPLMSVPAYKPASLLHGLDPASALDFAQFTEELNALQNYPMFPTNQTALQSLFAADPHSSSAFLSSAVASHLSKQPTALTTASPRSVGGRKNRMVEVKMINDRPVVIVSDPQAASSSARSSIVQLNRNVLGVLKGLESAKKQEISEEPLYSRKVFIGGLPIDVTEEEVWATFGYFGKVLVDWPRRPEHGGRGDFFEMEMGRRNSRSVSGYVFLVFQEERAVQQLVNACEFYDKKYYLQLSSPTMADKAVQVRAWKLSDIDYFADENAMVDHRKTVFIGGVPRPTRASDLARCLQEHYGKVSYVGIDIDPELRYPKGAARVTFATAQSFVRAISGRFVQVTHADTNKRVEIKPYVMEDQYCDECEGKLCKHNYAPYFCGDPSCLQYYCESCWDRMHYLMCDNRADHRPMVRTGDQTRVLPRPPHHNAQQQQFHSNNHHRSPRHQNSHMATSSQMDHSPHQQSSTSMISRIINRNHNNNVVGGAQKPFSAVPTAIGY